MPNFSPSYNPFALGHILGTSQAITASTGNAVSPIVLTLAGHGYATGNCIRISGMTGNTNANSDWVITVIDANTFSLNGSVGNGAFGGAPLAVRFLLPLTYNYPALTGTGVVVNSITFQAFVGNTGNMYVGGLEGGLISGIIPKRVTPFTDMVYIIKPGAVQNMPFFSPGAANIIDIDDFGIDWDSLGDGMLVSIYIR
jgi:hypothetical protein